MDSFEKHIKKNKAFFDEKAPNSRKMWEHIEAELDKGEHSHDNEPKLGSTIVGMILLLLVLVGIGLGINHVVESNKAPVLMAHNASEELNAIDHHYTRLVGLKIDQLRQSEQLSDLEKEDFLEYIEELTNEQSELKVKLEKNINNEEVLEAIIENFNQQIKLIQQLLERVNHTNNIQDETGIYI